jgi:hypothetical protein
VGRYVLGGMLRLLLLLILPLCVSAESPAPIESCISYEMNKIKSETGEFVLSNIFTDQLYESLDSKFPEVDVDWRQWTTKVENYVGDDGKNKTKLKGCFDISEIYADSKLIGSIMSAATERFQAAMKFYSSKSSDLLSDDKVNEMLNRFENTIAHESVKAAIEEKLK